MKLMNEFDSLFEEHQISVTLDEVVIKLLGISPDVLKPTCVTEYGEIKDNHYEVGALEYLLNEYERAESEFSNAMYSKREQEFYENTDKETDLISAFDPEEAEKLSAKFDLARESVIEGKRIYDLLSLEKSRLDRGSSSLLELDAKPKSGPSPDKYTKESVAKWSKEKLGRNIPEWDGFNRFNNTYDGEGPPYSNALLEVLFDAMREYEISKSTNKPHNSASLTAWLKDKYDEKGPFRTKEISGKTCEVMFKIANFDR